jgi:hypothetical protein
MTLWLYMCIHIYLKFLYASEQGSQPASHPAIQQASQPASQQPSQPPSTPASKPTNNRATPTMFPSIFGTIFGISVPVFRIRPVYGIGAVFGIRLFLESCSIFRIAFVPGEPGG